MLVTADGCENLSAGIPRTADEVEAWLRADASAASAASRSRALRSRLALALARLAQLLLRLAAGLAASLTFGSRAHRASSGSRLGAASTGARRRRQVASRCRRARARGRTRTGRRRSTPARTRRRAAPRARTGTRSAVTSSSSIADAGDLEVVGRRPARLRRLDVAADDVPLPADLGDDREHDRGLVVVSRAAPVARTCSAASSQARLFGVVGVPAIGMSSSHGCST